MPNTFSDTDPPLFSLSRGIENRIVVVGLNGLRNISRSQKPNPRSGEEEFLQGILLRRGGEIPLFHKRHFFNCGKFFSGINGFGADAVEVDTAGKVRRIKSNFIIAGFVELVVYDGSNFLS